MLPLPDFYDPKTVGTIYLERADLVAEAAEAYAKKHGVKPSGQDKFKVAAFGIDVQVGFCTPGASLFVPGAVEDTTRTVEWIYRNLDKLTGLFFSMDTHRVFQIFHPAWWVDAQGLVGAGDELMAQPDGSLFVASVNEISQLNLQ